MLTIATVLLLIVGAWMGSIFQRNADLLTLLVSTVHTKRHLRCLFLLTKAALMFGLA